MTKKSDLFNRRGGGRQKLFLTGSAGFGLLNHSACANKLQTLHCWLIHLWGNSYTSHNRVVILRLDCISSKS